MSDDVQRVKSVYDLPLLSLRCAALGRHVGFGQDDPRIKDVTGWGQFVKAVEVRYSCDCGRWRKDVIDAETGERLAKASEYGGGVLLWSGGSPDQHLAKVIYIAKVRERAAATAAEAAEGGTVTPLRLVN